LNFEFDLRSYQILSIAAILAVVGNAHPTKRLYQPTQSK